MSKRKSAFDVAPTSMTRTDFQISHPLIEITSGLVEKFNFKCEFQDDSIVRVNGVDKQLLDVFLLQHVLPSLQKFGQCNRQGNEMQFRDIASALFPAFTHLAPRPSDQLILENVESGKNINRGENDVVDLYMNDVRQLEKGIRNKFDCIHEDDFIHEDGMDLAPPQAVDFEDGADLAPPQAVDFRGRVEGGSFYTIMVGDSKRAGFIWNPKADDSTMYPLAYYASCAGIANVEKGRYMPVHMLILARGEFGVAVLEPEGYLMVDSKNQITQNSFDLFMQSREARWSAQNPGKSYACSNDEKVTLLKTYQEKLDESQRHMRMLLMEERVPSDLKLLVGRVVFNHWMSHHQWTLFPITTRGYKFTVGDYILMAGLMRVLYGDRVLFWDRGTLEALAKARDEELAELRISGI